VVFSASKRSAPEVCYIPYVRYKVYAQDEVRAIRQKWHHEKWGSRRMLGCKRPLKIRDQERPFPALKSADRVIIYMYLQKSGFFEPPRSELLINRYL